MKGLFFQFLLTQLIVLLGCHLLFSPYAVETGSHSAKSKAEISQGLDSLSEAHNNNDLCINSVLFDKQEQGIINESVFELEEKNKSFKRYFESNKCASHNLFTRIFGYFFTHKKQAPSFCKSICTLPHLYIMLQVFRL